MEIPAGEGGAVDWTEKYRPRSLDQMVGGVKAVADMRRWASSWSGAQLPKKRGMILEGDPGVGKTTMAVAITREMDWDLIELNASDARNLESVRLKATRGTMSRSITDVAGFEDGAPQRRKLILLDEADNLHEGSAKLGEGDLSDRGGKRAIIEMLKVTLQPVVLIVNDLYALTKGSGKPISFMCDRIKLRRLGAPSIAKRLRYICNREGIRYRDDIIDAISQRSGGDMRSAIMDLQLLSAGKTGISVDDLPVLGYRDTKESVFHVLERTFRSGSMKLSREALMESEETPETMALWFSENIHTEMPHPADLSGGMEILSKADRYLGRVRRRQNYRLWGYARDMMAGVWVARDHGRIYRAPYRFPEYLRSMSRTKDSRRLFNETSLFLGRATHTSVRTVKDDAFFRLGVLVGRDPDFAANLAVTAGLGKEHLSMLSSRKLANGELAAIIEAANTLRAERVIPTAFSGLDTFTDDGKEEKAPEKKGEEEKEAVRQSSLLQF